MNNPINKCICLFEDVTNEDHYFLQLKTTNIRKNKNKCINEYINEQMDSISFHMRDITSSKRVALKLI
jgi:hypothetical protein